MTHEARSEQRKTTTAATSSASPKRPSGTLPDWRSIASSRLIPSRAASCSASPPGPRHSGVPVGPGRDGVDVHAARRPEVGEQARERVLAGLGDRVRRPRLRRALAGARRDVDDPAPAALGHQRREVAHQPQRRHHVELERVVEVGVGQLVERLDLRRAGVVDEDVDGAAGALGDPLGGVRRGHVDALGARDADDARALVLEPVRDRRADPARGAGDDGGAAVDAQVHAQRAGMRRSLAS